MLDIRLIYGTADLQGKWTVSYGGAYTRMLNESSTFCKR